MRSQEGERREYLMQQSGYAQKANETSFDSERETFFEKNQTADAEAFKSFWEGDL